MTIMPNRQFLAFITAVIQLMLPDPDYPDREPVYVAGDLEQTLELLVRTLEAQSAAAYDDIKKTRPQRK